MLYKKDIEIYSNKSPPLKPLGRSPYFQEQYDKYISKRENREYFIKKIKSKLSYVSFHLHINDYPYNTEKDIKHWLIWWDEPIKIVDILENTFGERLITYWVNKTNNKSIREINHAHVFAFK